MKFRFNVQDAVYSVLNPTLCQPTVQSNYTGINCKIYVNNALAAQATNLATGLFFSVPFPAIIGGVNVLNVSLENSLYVNLELELVNLWDTAEVRVVLTKTGFITLDRSFTVFGYDIGKNPNIAITVINPDMYLIMIPTSYPAIKATTGVQNPAIGIQFSITADNYGTIGNGIQIIGTNNLGETIETLVAAWNLANPSNTVTVTYTIGGGYDPFNGETFTLSGGGNLPIVNKAYANFVGWRKPFKNSLYLHCVYSNIQDFVAYFNVEDKSLGKTHSLILPCYTGSAIHLISVIMAGCDCGCGQPEIVDTCEFGDLDFALLNLIPTFSCSTECENCCNDDCLVLINSNYTQFILDVSSITPLNVDDVEVVSVEEVTLTATVYDACGGLVSTDSILASLNPVPPLVDLQVPITFPVAGDYVVYCEMSSLAFKCTKVEQFTGCNYFRVTKLDCGKFKVDNLSINPISTFVKVLNKDRVFEDYLPTITIEPCESYIYTLAEDGVYCLIVEEEICQVLVVDCNMKACFVAYTKKRVCSPKADCACGGNCNGLCDKIPSDVYDFNAFSILVYNYLALINNLYVKDFMFTTFQPADIDRLFTIRQYLDRIKEYCGNCHNATVVQTKGGCGCNK